MDATTRTPAPRSPARWVVVGVLVLAALLAFGVRGLLAARVVQARAVAMIRAGNFAQALEEADLRLSREPDDPHLREVVVLAARSHVDHLLERRTPLAYVAAWPRTKPPGVLISAPPLRTPGRPAGAGEARRRRRQ